MDAADVDSGVALVGASMGGRLAIDFTLTHPESVSRLILAAPALGGHEWSKGVQRLWGEEDAALEAGDIDTAVELNLRLWVDGPRRERSAVPEHIRGSVGEMQRDAFEKLIAASEQKPPPEQMDEAEPPAAARLNEIQVPTLILVGDEDVADILDIAERASRGIPQARKVVIPGTAHMLNLEKPDEFADEVLGFLQESV